MSSSFPVNNLPVHVGIIMDGNGRWARAKGLSRNQGHKKGAQIFGDVVRHAKMRDIKYLTVYAFSTENWKRPPEEVRSIMNILRTYLKNACDYRKENVRIRVLGDRLALDKDLQEQIAHVEENSAGCDGLNLNIALNYGGRDEIVHAARCVAQKILNGEIALQQIDKAMLSDAMYTAGQPDVDLIIRTGGEQRISNFLLWQGAYAEFVFCDVCWPDFSPQDFDAALLQYSERTRKMGAV